MNKKADCLINELNKIKDIKDLIIVETGTIRNTSDEFCNGDGHSTRFISEWVRDNSGYFFSIDLDISIAKKYISSLELSRFVNFIEGNSLTCLKTFKKINLAYLDSANDAEIILNEFLIVWNVIPTGGIVIVDDCDLSNELLMKGRLLIPYLIQSNIKFTQNGDQIIIKK